MKSRSSKLQWFCLVSVLTSTLATAATLTVSTTDDNGPGSLRQALADAGAGDTITFDAGLAGGTITLSNGELLVTNSLSITGLGAAQLTISGNNASRIFHLTGPLTATISGLTIAAGAVPGDTGGGVLNEGPDSLILDACVLTGNSAQFGGAIYNTGSLTINNSTLTNNVATARGGGLANYATTTLSNSLVTANSAADAGGGIHNESTLTVLGGSRISANSAENFGGGINNQTGPVLLELSSLEGNTVGILGAGLANGIGGIATISQCTVTSNSCPLGGGFYSDGTIIVSRSTLTGNSAALTDGGAFHNDGNLLIVSSTLANNTAAQSGGAIMNFGTLRLAENTLTANSALNGGALALQAGTVTIDNTILANSPSGGNYIDTVGVTVSSLGHNLSDDASAAAVLTSPSDLNDTPAGLDPSGLQNNGGATPTVALASGSAAIMAGGPVYAPFTAAAGGGEPIYPPFTDQRGLPRFVCGKMDIGAFQTQDAPPPIINLLGDSVVTNECPAEFSDPGATASSTCADALSIAAGGAHSVALRTDGTVATWGDTTGGLDILPLGLNQASAVAAGDFHNLALQPDGIVVGWGDNSSNQINIPASVTNAIAIAAGSLHSLALLNDGTVIGWGDDSAGQTDVPGGLNSVVAIAAGQFHSLALISDGTVVGWGTNSSNQISIPASVTNANAIAAGNLHSLALLNDGTVIGWGDDSAGQTDVPAGATNVVAIAAGGQHSLALLADGSVLAWGANGAGQTNVPASLNNGAAVAAGSAHSLAITRDGAVTGWGLNSNGQAVATVELRAGDLSSSITQSTVGTTNGIGSFTRTYSIVDAHGTTSSVVRSVVTVDTAAPVPNVATLPSLTNSCAVTLTPPTATDACVGAITGTTGDLTSYNTPGTFVVTWTYSDGHGNSINQPQTVVIDRISPPSIICSSDIVVTNLPNQCGATVNYTAPVVTPDCPTATTTQTGGLPSGALFPVGITTNTFRVIDASTNTNSCTFTVTVLDRQAPTLTCPANIITNTAPGQCQSPAIAFTPTVSDNCPGVTVVSVPPSGSTFAKGTNTVTCTATDASGNTNSCSFTITVLDQQAPSITCPANIVTNTAPGQCQSAAIAFNPTVSDNCPGVTVVSVPPSGSTFAKGTNTVTCTATDASGNTNSCTFTVTVVDQQVPSITCPANIVTNTVLGQCQSAPITFAPTVSDNCPGTTVVSVPPSGSTFAKGTNTVTCTVTDASGNTNSCSFTITVLDQQAPLITCPANIITNTAPGQCQSAAIAFTPTVSDNCPGVTVVSVPPSGSTFPKGTNTVTCTATDAAGNTNSCSFTVTVLDQQAPSITCPANIITNTAPGQCTSVPLTFTPTASDNCPGVSVVSIPASGSTFAKGVTTVTCTATDAAGNTNSCTFTVTVLNQQAPTITCPANIVTNTAPNQCQSAAITFAPTVSDNCPGFTVVSVPPSGSTFPKGTDTVTCTAFDDSGNTNSCTFTITVLDKQVPTITCPANIITNTALDQCQSAALTFAPTVSDNCPGVTVVSVPASGSTFPKGVTTVTCTATDAAGNTNSCTFTVSVADQQAPTITCPLDIITNATSVAGTVVTFAAPTISDNCPGVTLSNAPGSLVSGDTFPVGSTTVTRIARDAAGNQTTCSFTVTVGGPQADFQTVEANLTTLRNQTTDSADLKQLDGVLAKLGQTDSLWIDPSHVDGKTGKKLFSLTSTVLKTLQKLIDSTKSTLPDAPLQAAIDRLLVATRIVAQVEISDATLAGADVDAIAKANAEIVSGQIDESAGNATNATKHYGKAWTTVAKALAKLN